MQAPPKPANEAERLAALHALLLLDTPPEQRFNRITRTAARVFDVPAALVSLVDAERQWFKSRYGLHVSETPRSVSFCGHAILQDIAFVIEDARLDARFADNPVVTGPPHVRFYAGQPLSGPGGVKLGTLCIIDYQPRKFSVDDRLTLADMAGWVERELYLDRDQSATQARLNSVLASVDDAILIAGEDGGIETLNERAARLFGYDAHELVGEPIDRMLNGAQQPGGEAGLLARLKNLPQGLDGARIEWSARRKDGSSIAASAAVSDFLALGRRMYTLNVRERG